jgi:putative transcriptional regulator
MKKSRILKELHETARGLKKAGAIEKQTMREFDVLCMPPVRNLSAAQIRAIRARAKMSQAGLHTCKPLRVKHLGWLCKRYRAMP